MVLLALAIEAHAALAAQTGGAAPTMRTALYRMMADHGLPKAPRPLANQTAECAQGRGVLPRDFWADPEPSTITRPAGGSSPRASAFRRPAAPSDPLARTGHVFGVVTETRGAAPPLAGAIEQRLGFEIPVWHTGGMGSIPRRLHIEEQMLEWAERTGGEPHLLVITDYDPSGVIIANAVDEEVRDVDVQRIGMLPDQAPSPALTSIGSRTTTRTTRTASQRLAGGRGRARRGRVPGRGRRLRRAGPTRSPRPSRSTSTWTTPTTSTAPSGTTPTG